MNRFRFAVLFVPRTQNVRPLGVCSTYADFIYTSNGQIGKMRTRIWSLANASDKSGAALSLDESIREFLQISSSTQRSHLVAMDAIGLIKLCRMFSQPYRITVLWPCILKTGLLPAKEDRTSLTLVGSVVASVLEAKDTTTAASVWAFVRSSPWLSLSDANIIQLLSALRERPDLVMDMVTELLQGRLGVHANVKHLTAALKALSNAPNEAKRVFELASERNMVTFLFFAFAIPLTLFFQIR
jgi:hypothetical protein